MKEIATEAEVQRLLNATCQFHGIARVEFSPGVFMITGIRGPAAELACSLLKLFRDMARTGKLPQVDIEAIEAGIATSSRLKTQKKARVLKKR